MVAASGTQEIISVGDEKFVLGEQLEHLTLDTITPYAGELAVVQRIDDAGEPFTRRAPVPFALTHALKVNEICEYTRICKERRASTVTSPPHVGILQPFTAGYFAIQQHETHTTSLIPYNSEQFRYLAWLATIAE